MVREEFDKIAQRRLKDLVSHYRTINTRPKWIAQTIWAEMEAKWATADAKTKSTNASQNRLSEREGLGVAKHVGGPRSYTQIKRAEEARQGRPIGIGEIFVKTHTRKDGSFVDEKARKIAEAYDAKIQTKMTELASTDPSMLSDGTSKLTTTELDKMFLEAIIPDERGNPYGLGSLARSLGTSAASSSSYAAISSLQEQLQAAQRRIEEQDEENRRRDEEFARREAETKTEMATILSFLQTNPDFQRFMQSKSSEASASVDATPRNDDASS